MQILGHLRRRPSLSHYSLKTSDGEYDDDDDDDDHNNDDLFFPTIHGCVVSRNRKIVASPISRKYVDKFLEIGKSSFSYFLTLFDL